MKSVDKAPRVPRETQPQHLIPLTTRFITLYGNELNEESKAFIDKILQRTTNLLPRVIDASQLTAEQAVRQVADELPKNGHLLVCNHGNNAQFHGHNKHYVSWPDQDDPVITTESLVQRVVDALGIRPDRVDRPGQSLPFIYFYSCYSGALRKQMTPGSDLWKCANLLIFAGDCTTSVLSSGNSLASAVAYVDHCQRTMQSVDPLKLLFFAGVCRGDSVTLMGGKLSAPLVWHAPRPGREQYRIDNLSGMQADLERFQQAIASISHAEYRLVPPASLTEVLCNRIARDDVDAIGQLLEAHPELRDHRAALDTLPLEFAAEMQAHDSLCLLLNAGADPNASNSRGNTALMATVRYPNCVCRDVDALLARGADPNRQNKVGMSALMFACQEGHAEAVRILLAHGADPALQNDERETALALACQNQHIGAAGLMLKAKANPNVPSRIGLSALMWAATSPDPGLLQMLLEHGANPDWQDDAKNTALIVAAERARTDIMRVLIEHGADLDKQRADGMTALIFAVDFDDTESLKLLLARGANPNLQDEHDMTAMMYAVDNDDTAPLELLLSAGARIDLFNLDGQSALTSAALNNRLDALRHLLAAGGSRAAGLSPALIASTRQLGHDEAAERLQQAFDQDEAQE